MNPGWPDSKTFWRNKRVTVTGGAGFLGCFVVDKLQQRGATEICVPRKRDYDLVQRHWGLVVPRICETWKTST